MPAKVAIQTVKNRYFLKQFEAHMRAEHASENFNFLFDKGSNQVLYEKYIKVGSAQEVNISNALRRPLDTLAAAKKWSGMSAGIAAARKEIALIVDQGPVRSFLATPAGKLAAFMLALRLDDESKASLLDGLLTVYKTGRTPQDKQEAYQGMLKLANMSVLNPALRDLGVTPPAPAVRAKGDPSKALRLLGLDGAEKTKMTKLIADYTKAVSKTNRATVLDQMEQVSKDVVKRDGIIAALKSSGLYVAD